MSGFGIALIHILLCPYSSPIKKFLTSFFRGLFYFDKTSSFSTFLITNYQFTRFYTIFLILPNVKIPSPLARVKIDRAEL